MREYCNNTKNNKLVLVNSALQNKPPCVSLISHASLYVNRNRVISAADKHIHAERTELI